MTRIIFTILICSVGITSYAQKTPKSNGLFSSLVDTSMFSIKKHKPAVPKMQSFKLSPLAFSEPIAQVERSSSNTMPIIKPEGDYSIPNYYEESKDKRSLIIFDAK